MKPRKNDLPSVYDAKTFRKAGFKINPVTLIALLVLLLVAARFLNTTMWWYSGKLELEENIASSRAVYGFLYFAGADTAMEKCRELSLRAGTGGVGVVSVFNPLYRGQFTVHNDGAFKAVNLGHVVVPLEPGRFTVRVSAAGFLEKQRHNGSDSVQTGYFGSPWLGRLLGWGTGNGTAPSFLLNPPQKSIYLQIPYLAYFYLPLLGILILAGAYTRAVWAGFLYYPLLFLLFDFKQHLFSVPLHWLTETLGLELTPVMETVAASVVTLLFTVAGIIGWAYRKQMREVFRERLLVLFFILLPFFLRF